MPDDGLDEIRSEIKLLWMKRTSLTLDATLSDIGKMNDNVDRLKMTPTMKSLSINEIIKTKNDLKTLYEKNHDLEKLVFKMNLHKDCDFVHEIRNLDVISYQLKSKKDHKNHLNM